MVEKYFRITKWDIISRYNRDILSMDGKTSNGSKGNIEINENANANVVNTMSVYSTNYGMSLIQDYIEDKTNVIPIGPKLLEKLNLKGWVVTADALNTNVFKLLDVAKLLQLKNT